ncbi:hypothetical protein AAG570_010037 [Ranatra chinensis]|uniref:Uncharacterized protein n=1 Tax=Ranatra chinensis TaxID=642074 RepID=A0ABD0YNK1_9HEMI
MSGPLSLGNEGVVGIIEYFGGMPLATSRRVLQPYDSSGGCSQYLLPPDIYPPRLVGYHNGWHTMGGLYWRIKRPQNGGKEEYSHPKWGYKDDIIFYLGTLC